MRVFLDTKSDRLRVELAQGEVAATYTTAPESGERPDDAPTLELDVAKGGEVLVMRLIGVGDVLRRIQPQA